jgi:hypothetical protein
VVAINSFNTEELMMSSHEKIETVETATLQAAVREPRMPFSAWYPAICGAVFGIAMRLVVFTGTPGTAYAPMLGSFIYLIPLLVGAVTVYIAERTKRRSWGYYFWAPFLANVCFIIGTLLIMVEGLICAVVILPMFSVLGGIGGLAMGCACRLTNWPKQALYGLAALPLLLGSIEHNFELPIEQARIERTIHIAAKPEVVWQQINHVKHIFPQEIEHAWVYRIGAPLAVSASTTETPLGVVRKMTWDKGVHFDGKVINWQPNRVVQWSYKFYLDSFPAGVLDDHVVIGGRYFDLLDSTYSLTPKDDGTDLSLKVHYRISTQFNVYASWVAKLLLGNFENTMLEFYKNRIELNAKG